LLFTKGIKLVSRLVSAEELELIERVPSVSVQGKEILLIEYTRRVRLPKQSVLAAVADGHKPPPED